MIAALTIREQWENFKSRVMPPDAPPYQVREMRRAFHAGAAAMLEINEQIGDPDITDDEGCRILDRINAELHEFARRMQEGKA